jgi:hypothetical protein
VTAKESLSTYVARLSEAEAAAMLARIRPLPARATPSDRGAALALLQSWRKEAPVMTDDEWEQFAREFDHERSERPLFS